MAMDKNKLKEDLQMNEYLTKALSKHLEGSSKERDEILLLTQAKLLDVLKELVKESSVQPLVDLQVALSRILAMATDEIDMEEVFRFHQLVSKAMRNNSKREALILVNMELSQAMIVGSQEVIREKLVSVLSLLSQGVTDGTGNDDMKVLFKLNEALSKVVAEKSDEKKLDLIATSNLHIAEFMFAGYRDTSTEWLMELNLFAALAFVEKAGNPIIFFKAIKLLTQEIKKMPDEAFIEDLMELNFSLTHLLPPEAGAEIPIATFRKQLIAWKMQLSTVMHEIVGGSSKTKKTTAAENMSSQLEAVLAENAKLKKENAELIQAKGESDEGRRRGIVLAAEQRGKIEELAREFGRMQVKLRDVAAEQNGKIDELAKEFGKMQEKFRDVAEGSAGKQNVGGETKADVDGAVGKQGVGDERKAGAEEATSSKNTEEEFLRKREIFLKKHRSTEDGVGEPGQVNSQVNPPQRKLTIGLQHRRQIIDDAHRVRDDEKLNQFEGWEKRKKANKNIA